MKNIFKCTLIFMTIASSSSDLYDWNVKTVENEKPIIQNGAAAESDTEFGDEFKVQTALNKEMQRDLLKLSGRANDKYIISKDENYNNENKYPVNYGDKIDLLDGFKYENAVHNNNVNGKEAADIQIVTKPKEQDNKEENRQDDYFTAAALSAEGIRNNRREQKQHLEQYIHKNDGVGNNSNRQLDDNSARDFYNSQREISKSTIPKKNRGIFPKYEDSNGFNRDVYENPYAQWNDNFDLNENNAKKNNEAAKQDNDLNENHNQFENVINSGMNHKEDKNCRVMEDLEIEDFLGSNLFGNSPKKCFSAEDIQMLIIRRDFENLIPKELPKALLTDEMLMILMDYFHTCHQLITTMDSEDSNNISEKVFFDTLGGYLNFYLVPVAKYSYYAGLSSLKSVQNILTLHEQCKIALNTNGNDWQEPMDEVLNELEVVNIEPLKINYNNYQSSCEHLQLSENQGLENDKMIVALPKLQGDDERGHLGNIWLPFRRKRIYDLKSSESPYIVVEFYTTLRKCYRHVGISPRFYNRELKQWVLENIQIHLSDEVFYPGLGGILRILESIRRYPRTKNYKTEKYHHYEDYDERGENSVPMEIRQKKSYMSGRERKSKEFLDILKKSKHQESYHPKMWPQEIYDHYNGDYTDYLEEEIDTTKQKPSEIPKAEKGKVKEITNVSSNQLEQLNTTRDTPNKSKDKFNFTWLEYPPYVIAIVIAIPIVALISVAVVCCLKLRRKQKTAKEVRLRGYGDPKRKSSIHNNDEETELLNAQSKSVVPGYNSKSLSQSMRNNNHHRKSKYTNVPNSTGSTSSSLSCQIPTRCFRTKPSGPAIIETMSLNYSSSDVEDTANLLKTPPKAVRINEKPTTSAVTKNSGKSEKRKEAGKTKDLSKSNVQM